MFASPLSASVRMDAQPDRGVFVTIEAKQPSQWLHRWVWVLFDAAIWFVAIFGATWLRYDFTDPSILTHATATFAGVAGVTYLVIGAAIGPYSVGHKRGSFEETTDLGRTVLATASGLFILAFVANPLMVPHSVPVVAGTLALVGMFAA